MEVMPMPCGHLPMTTSRPVQGDDRNVAQQLKHGTGRGALAGRGAVGQRFSPCRSIRVSRRAIKYTQPRAAIREGISKTMGAMAAGFLAHLQLSAAAGCPF
jgi:hypothetical protein